MRLGATMDDSYCLTAPGGLEKQDGHRTPLSFDGTPQNAVTHWQGHRVTLAPLAAYRVEMRHALPTCRALDEAAA